MLPPSATAVPPWPTNSCATRPIRLVASATQATKPASCNTLEIAFGPEAMDRAIITAMRRAPLVGVLLVVAAGSASPGRKTDIYSEPEGAAGYFTDIDSRTVGTGSAFHVDAPTGAAPVI